MLKVKAFDEVFETIDEKFCVDSVNSLNTDIKPDMLETICVTDAVGRILHNDIVSNEDVPGFDRSTVDGYTVIASDTFGASESIPAILNVIGDVTMGEKADFTVNTGFCVGISTGGDFPDGCNAAVMVEHTEDYGDGLVGIMKPVAPGNNMIFRGDDVKKGTKILKAGSVLTVSDVGILSALGYASVDVRRSLKVGIISTGDELVPPSDVPKRGQIRDVNTPMLMAQITGFGCVAVNYGIIKDEESLLNSAVLKASSECDVVLVSGGSSAGLRDLTARIIENEGELLFHGIAIKPGKPTILGVVNGKPVFGLPGHPVAAYFITELFVRHLLMRMCGADFIRKSTTAKLSEAISSNHGRAECIPVRLATCQGSPFGAPRGQSLRLAVPVRGKSGLIATLADTQGYIIVPRDCEGIAKDETVEVFYLK